MTLKAVEQGQNATDGHNKNLGYAGKLIRKRRYRHKFRFPAVRPPSTIQKLYNACKKVFKGPGTVPCPDDVQKLCHILDNMVPEDVGLSAELEFFKANDDKFGNPRVISTTIYKCDKFSLCMFFLPTGGIIPLHNHPGMTVFSKLLVGKMHIKSYDWADNSNCDKSPNTSQELKADREFTAPCDTSVLYPTTGGNMHAFTAITPCAVLDVLGPPYSEKDGRDCSYYKDFPYSAFSNTDDGNGSTDTVNGKCYGWLQQIETPKNSEMDGIQYLGPPIVDD